MTACWKTLLAWTCSALVAFHFAWNETAISAELDVVPSLGLDTAAFPLGPFTPSAQTYVLSNTTTTPLPWAAGADQAWVSLTLRAGVLSNGSSTAVTAFLNSSALYLPPGLHSANVWFTNMGQPEVRMSRKFTAAVVLPAAPTIESVSLASSRLQVRLTGTPGSSVVVESSADLVEWRGEQTNTLDTSWGAFDFVIGSDPGRFFRANSGGPDAEPAFLTFSNYVTYAVDPAQVRVVGQANGVYLLEASRDQAQWTRAALRKICGTESFLFTNKSEPATGFVYRASAVAPAALEFVDHVLIVGQSLAIGTEGAPALTAAVSARHLRFYTQDGLDYLNALYELGAETIASSAANQASLNAPQLRLMLSNVGLGGAEYAQLKKGTDNYAHGIEQIQRAPAVVACRLFRHRPSALFCVHGEGDLNNPRYDEDIRQWQADYEADFRELSGLPVKVPMFHTQISAWTYGGGPTHAVSPYRLLAEAEANPTKTVLVGPKYFLPYSLPLGVHLNNYGYRWLGEYYGKVFKRVVLDGEVWSPLRPLNITRSGPVITARFRVPVPPLVLDTDLVSDPGHYGFEYYDESASPPAIASVELAPEEDAVRITLTAEPALNSNPRLRYAYTGISGNPGGPTTGPRGNLRDSDSEPSLSENPLYNWCVHFDKPIPF